MIFKYAIALAIVLLLAAFLAWAFLPARHLPGHRARHLRIRLHLRLHPGKGFATAVSLWLRWGRLTALRRSARIRPSLPLRYRLVDPREHSVFLGRAHYRHGLRVPLEEHLLVMAPPRTYKTAFLADVILRYPGPVIATTTKADIHALTSAVRAQLGPVHVFNPQYIGGVPSTFRWSPVDGCQDPATAIRRADAFAFAVSQKGVEDGTFWACCKSLLGVLPGRMRFMSRKYLPVNREKPMFLPLDMQSWVPKDHFVWFLVDVAGQLDTSALQAGTSPGKGRPGYDPQMLATLVMYAMSCGVRSSREIEDRTRVDAGFRIASAGQFPDHSTLCRFRQRTGGEDGPLEDLFTQVLYVCAVAGLGRLRVISVDGSKIWADAAKEANRTLEGLRKLSRKVLEEAAAADGDCGCQGHGHGEAAGGEGMDGCGCCDGGMLPGLGLCGPAVLPRGWGGASRNERIAAALADLEAARGGGGCGTPEASRSLPGEGAGRAGAAGPDTGGGRGHGRADRAGAGDRRAAGQARCL